MRFPSPALVATLRALHGETDLQIIAHAFGDLQFARVLALAPDVDPVISALGALAGWTPGLLTPITPTDVESPSLHAAVVSLIGTNAGEHILRSWADVAPAGWGASHAAALLDAVRARHCLYPVAATLIGPCDTSAMLLRGSWEIAAAIRRWGQATPNDPTAWKDALTPAERDRLLDALCDNPIAAVRALPWLPEEHAALLAQRLAAKDSFHAFAAYTEASPIARTRHANILASLIQRAEPGDLADLTRLAVASSMDDAWAAVVRLLSATPTSALHVVAAMPWDALRPDVQTVILSAADHNAVCAAIAFARGACSDMPPITQDAARAFFAAVTPTIWDALPEVMQCMWRNNLDSWYAHLAVRSLGPDPAFLARAVFNDALFPAVRRHAADEGVVRRMLLPVAVRGLPLADVPHLVTALQPPDSVAFAQIAGGSRRMPPTLRDWIAAHPTAQAAAAAVTVLRVAARSVGDDVVACCPALAAAFTGWSLEEMTALLAALPDDVVAALRPNVDTLANALAPPAQRDAFRQALDAITTLPPSAALPSLHALDALTASTEIRRRRQAGKELARALRDHGDCFAAIVGALRPNVRTALLPPSNDPQIESALRDITAADPLVAYALAHTLRSRNPTAAIDTLAATRPQEARRIWHMLPETLQQSVLGDRDALFRDVAAPGRADALAQTLRGGDADEPLLLLALRMLLDADEERRAWGAAMLAQRPDAAASLLPLLRDDLQTTLAFDPVIRFASADLPPDRKRPSTLVRRQR